MEYRSKYSKYIGFINNTMRNRNIDTDESFSINGAQLKDIVCSKKNVVIINSLALGIVSSELMLITRVRTIRNGLEEVSKCLADEINNLFNQNININEFDSVNIARIVDSIEIKAKLRQNFNRVVKSIKDKCKSLKNITFVSTYYVDKEIQKDKVSINYLHSPQMLMVPPIEFKINVPTTKEEINNTQRNLIGYVFSVKLFDIVSVYNKLGDELFKDNVRYGIGEQMGVDKAIKDTLENAPEYFWFRNNGITMIFEGPDSILNQPNEIILKSVGEKKIKFSVINGAQTINAAAEYFYSQEIKLNDESIDSMEVEKKLKSAKNAQVLLRIIQIEDKNNKEEAKKISIALNRQKPIKHEDIAFANRFVSKINNYLDSNKLGYNIAKRSEISYSKNEYSLIDFARACKACAGYPGEARSKDSSSLLRLNNKNGEDEKFVDTSIFVNEWYEHNDIITNKKTFNKYYAPVLFAMKLAHLYEQIHKSILKNKKHNLDATSEIVVTNGKWYFVAFTIYCLNGNKDDYSHFCYSIDSINMDETVELIVLFAKFYSDYSKSKSVSISSNTFKVSKSYYELLLTSFKTSDYYRKLGKLFDIKNKESAINDKLYLVKLAFQNSSRTVKTISDAFEYTLTECLKYGYSSQDNLDDIDNYIINSTYLSFDDRKNGYFRTRKEIFVGNKKIFIGTKNDFEIKKRFVNDLCAFLKIPKRSVCWCNEQGIELYSNS